ncbi:MAG: phenylalanine--tRNA ligase subunit beta [Actinomycetota bacterium]
MKVVLSWLREVCPTDLAADELAERLTANGVKVEDVLWPWRGLSGVVAARVLEVRDHPGSEKLCLARVADGSGEREIVVGVRNMRPGDVVPYAPPGARVPSLDQPLGRKEIRGVASEGMLCSPSELAVSTNHGGILILPAGLAPGSDLKTALGLDDAVFDIEIEPNRPDLMSVFGVARETAIATGAPLIEPDITVDEAGEKAENEASVEVPDLERCPRYVARVIRGVEERPSPIVAQARLTASGMRPISSIVDATNYAMLELGHPLHPFDLDLLAGRTVVVRRAADGEKLVTLDGVERILSAEDLLIADQEKGIALAGVMGSAAAEVSERTRDVLLESAYFEPRAILRTARRIGLSTEASQRFERGADPEAPPRAADRAARLIVEWSGGTILAGAIDVGGAPPRRRIRIRPSRASVVLGRDVSAEVVRDALQRAWMPVSGNDDVLEAEVPGFRVDVVREEDLIEEVARIEGYDQVGSMLPPVRQAGALGPRQELRRRIRSAAVAAGLREIRSLSFASAEDLETFGGESIRIANPLAAEEGFLRASLLPGMLRALSRNLARQLPGATLFEVGTVFAPGDPVAERERLAIAMTGSAAGSWHDADRAVDFFDVKGALDALLGSLGITGWSLEAGLERPFHPGRSATVLFGGERAGSVGELHPSVASRFDLPARVAVAELDVVTLGEAIGSFELRPVPRFPPVRRDLAFILDSGVSADDVERSIREAGGDLVSELRLFDVFVGAPVPEGKRSLAFAVDFRAPDRTLTDEEVAEAVAAVVERIRTGFGGDLRSG